MSHELRTPLNAVLGFAPAARARRAPPTQREAVDQILQGRPAPARPHQRGARHLPHRVRRPHALARAGARRRRSSGTASTSSRPLARPARHRAGQPRPARRTGLRARRPPAPQAGAAQPAVERDEVQPGRRHGRRSTCRRHGDDAAADRGHRHRTRHRARAARRCSRRSSGSAPTQAASRAPASASRCRSGWPRPWAGPSRSSQHGRATGSTFWVELPVVEGPAAAAYDDRRRRRRRRHASEVPTTSDRPLHRGQPGQPRASSSASWRRRRTSSWCRPCRAGSASTSPASTVPTSSCSTCTSPTSAATTCSSASATTRGRAASRWSSCAPTPPPRQIQRLPPAPGPATTSPSPSTCRAFLALLDDRLG